MEQPLDGIDANWARFLDEAQQIVGFDARALAAARSEVFELVEALFGESSGDA